MTPLEMISGDREDYEDDENDAQSYIGSEKVTLISYEVFRGFFLVNSVKKKKKIRLYDGLLIRRDWKLARWQNVLSIGK